MGIAGVSVLKEKSVLELVMQAMAVLGRRQGWCR
jgi:hypothetical protein